MTEFYISLRVKISRVKISAEVGVRIRVKVKVRFVLWFLLFLLRKAFQFYS
jgi:hypothetical protein